MHEEIGTAAGVLWRYLEKHGASTLGKVKRGTRMTDPILLMALGWLAREGKVHLLRDRRGLQISLNGH
jgi:hypothetical protein